MENAGWTNTGKNKGHSTTIIDPYHTGLSWSSRKTRIQTFMHHVMWRNAMEHVIELTLSQLVGLSEEMGRKQTLHLHPCVTLSSLFRLNVHLCHTYARSQSFFGLMIKDREEREMGRKQRNQYL